MAYLPATNDLSSFMSLMMGGMGGMGGGGEMAVVPAAPMGG